MKKRHGRELGGGWVRSGKIRGWWVVCCVFFFQAEDGIRDRLVTGVQTCALPIFANSAFTTIIITFIFATYFAKQIAPNPILGQSYWGWTIGITGLLVAIVGPVAGSFADKKNKIVFFIRCFSLLCILFTALLWFSKPSQSYLLYTLVIVGIDRKSVV